MRFRIFTVPAAALALALSATPAHAQWGRVFGQDRDDYRYGNARQVAYDNGYREGMDHGQKAARDRKPFDLEREKDYRNADEGYRREYGNKDRYRQDFRRGFAEGYRAAYDRYGYNGGYGGNYPGDRGRAHPRGNGTYYPNDGRVYGGVYGAPGSGGYGYGYGTQAAFDNGLNDGSQKGQEDARNGKSFDPTRHKWYRSANRNYNDRLGISKNAYENEYRRGFQQGYDQAYRGSRRW